MTLEDLAGYPFLGYNPRSRSGEVIARAFAERGLIPRYVVSAHDSDVIKAYVAEGLGIAVVPSVAVDPAADRALHATDVTALFARSRMVISLRRGAYARRYLTDFIEMLAPQWRREAVLRVLRGERM